MTDFFRFYLNISYCDMGRGLKATASVNINASIDKVWVALTDPTIIKKYMFGTEVVTNWDVGSSIIWKGIWEGKTYEDKGIILEKVPLKTLKVSHFSPLSGLPDIDENYHTLIYNLSSKGKTTALILTQDNNPNEESRNHSQKNWEMMLEKLKRTLEE